MDNAHMNEVTLCLAYYENPKMLHRQYQAIAAVPAELRAHLRVIVVDDGSPDAPAAAPAFRYIEPREASVLPKFDAATESEQAFHARRRLGVVSFQLYRMDVDVRWNQDACRNLAASQAETKWLLLTDIDHLVPAATWSRIVTGRLSWKSIYTFARLTGATLSHRNPHPNSWLLTTEMFDAAGGYDERFAGYYGTDGDFKRRLERVGKIEQLPEALHEVTPDVCDDCRTVRYGRKEAQDRAAIPAITKERGSKPPIRNRFPWHRVI